MPTHSAPEEIWDKIQIGLTDSPPKRPFQLWYVVAAAAVILLGFILSTRFLQTLRNPSPFA